MKVLLIAYYFPPSPEVGGLRARKIAEFLKGRGHSVHVLAGPVTAGSHDDEIEGIEVVRIHRSVDLRGLYFRMRGRHNASAAVGGGGSSGTAWKPPTHTSFVKRQISSALWLPDDRQGWILPAARAGARLVRTHRIDLIASTSPPVSPHLAALLVKKRTRIPWVAEFRDPWTDNPSKPFFVRSRWSDATERWLERLVFRHADTIVTVTDAFARLVRKRLRGAPAGKVMVVRNGIDDVDPPQEPAQRPVQQVVYVGSLYGDRDPRPLFQSLARLRARGALPSPLTVEFIGDCRFLMGESMQAAVDDLGLNDVVQFTDPLPHAECLRRIRNADLLLLLAQGQPLQVPNKLYEYFGVRLPVLAFVDHDGETARMLNDIGGNAVITQHQPDDSVDRIIEAALSARLPATDGRAEGMLLEWTTDRQLEMLNGRMESLVV